MYIDTHTHHTLTLMCCFYQHNEVNCLLKLIIFSTLTIRPFLARFSRWFFGDIVVVAKAQSEKTEHHAPHLKITNFENVVCVCPCLCDSDLQTLKMQFV